MDQYQLYVILAPFALIISVFITLYAWLHRKQANAANLAMLMLPVVGYLITNTLELVDPTPEGTLFWAKAGYCFGPFIGIFWLGFACEYTGRREWLESHRFWPFFIIPITGVFLVQTNAWSHLIWTSTTFTWHGSFLALSVTYGLAFWPVILYSYLCLGIGVYLVVRDFVIYSRGYRRQIMWILVGMVFPLVAHICYIFHAIPAWKKDYSPIGFVFTGIALAVGIFRYKLIGLAPIARSLVVDYIEDGICVLDTSNQIVDANMALLKILGLHISDMLGQQAEVRLPFWKHVVDSEKTGQPIAAAEIIRSAKTYSFDIDVIPIRRKDGNLIGRLVTLHDVTERKSLMAIVEQMAITDAVTGLYNRRYFDQRARDEMERAQRYQHPLAVMMLDLDGFKQINDNHGHGAGDDALVSIANILQDSVRKIDTLARFGGDEFILLLPETNLDEALKVAERIRSSVAGNTSTEDLGEYKITVSIGLACIDNGKSISMEEITQNADLALYKAKREGGNRVSVFCSEDLRVASDPPTAAAVG